MNGGRILNLATLRVACEFAQMVAANSAGSLRQSIEKAQDPIGPTLSLRPTGFAGTWAMLRIACEFHFVKLNRFFPPEHRKSTGQNMPCAFSTPDRIRTCDLLRRRQTL